MSNKRTWIKNFNKFENTILGPLPSLSGLSWIKEILAFWGWRVSALQNCVDYSVIQAIQGKLDNNYS